jgi:hypothetical protein
MPDKTVFRKDLETIINCNSMENGSNTPDFILANYLAGCLELFDKTVAAREVWYGRDPNVGPGAAPTPLTTLDSSPHPVLVDEIDTDPGRKQS